MKRVLFVLLAATLVYGCQGPAAHVTPATTQTNEKTPGSSVAVTVVLKVPVASASSKLRPNYISLATKSFSVLVNLPGVSASLSTANVSPTSPNCSSASGALLCSVQVDAPSGQDAFTVTTYDQPLTASGATQGNELSTGQANATIVLHQTNTVDVTLDGVPAQVVMSIPNLTPPQGTPITQTISLNIEDADGYTIVGPYNLAVQIRANNGNGGPLTIDVNGQPGGAITKPSDVATLIYTGKGIDSAPITAQLANTAYGVYAATLTFAPTPTFGSETTFSGSFVGSRINVNNPTYVISQANPAQIITGTFGGTSSTIAIPSGHAPQQLMFGLDQIDFNEAGALGMAFTSGPSSGNVVEYTAPGTTPTVSCVTGFDGLYRLWFMESNLATLAYMNTTGGFTEYPIPIAGAAPSSCSFGFNTYVWYSDPGTNAFGYFNESTNTFSEFPIPTTGANPGDIISVDTSQNGPEMWFIERGAPKMGIFSLQTNGVYEFPLGGAPVRVAGGINMSYVWVLLANGNLERINQTTHAYTDVSVPSSSNGPIVDLVDDGFELDILRGDATHASLQQYYY